MTDSESKRTEYLWDHMSVMERVDVLRNRINTLGQCIDMVNDALWDASGTVDSPIRDLARRVAEIEKGVKASDAMPDDRADFYRRLNDTYSGILSRKLADLGLTHPAEVMVTKAELARLRRIEEAARAVANSNFTTEHVAWGNAMIRVNALRSALDSEPKR